MMFKMERISMDPESPINLAQQLERRAKRVVLQGKYDLATVCYQEAAIHMEEALLQTQNVSALQSINEQLERYHKQPQIIKIQQQWASRKHRAMLSMGRTDHATEREAAVDAAGESDHVMRDKHKEMFGDLNSRFSSLEETDSLLAVINEHFSMENEQPRYRVSRLLDGIKALGLFGTTHRHPDNPTPKPLPMDRTLLLAQNDELRNHLLQLFKVLEEYKCENVDLRRSMQELTQQLASRGGPLSTHEDSESGLHAPFAAMDAYQCLAPLESLPTLEPLEIGGFDTSDQ